jgi:hypothetical protein
MWKGSSSYVRFIGDRRLLAPCTLTFLALYSGLIPAEEEFLSQKFRDEYRAYCRHVPRLLPTAYGMDRGRQETV